ncbi:MAG: glucuronate isomerase [Frankiaceae bacterium]|nr:glucuronate isomerase [Frankiaceae bacterium]
MQLTLHPDRALPAEPALRDIARDIYRQTRALPLVCMHGHIDAAVVAGNAAFDDPAGLLVTPDHYVTRQLVSAGISLADLGIAGAAQPATADSREVWRTFCAHWHLFRGTPSRYWLEHQLVELLGVDVRPSAETADAIYDRICVRLAEPEFRPRALLDTFGIEVLATTDSATSRLTEHALLRDEGFGGRVVPTFRPDGLVHIDRPHWADRVRDLAQLTGADTQTYAGFLAAIRARRADFAALGARATDHGHLRADCERLSPAAAERTYRQALADDLAPGAAAAFAGHMLHEMALMSCADGLVMQLHVGVWRDHDSGIEAEYGSDRGFDIPIAAEFTRALQPILRSVGRDPRFRLILFTVDESTYSRELAPLAGVYPSVRLGAPWWFLDSPDGLRRFRELVTETAGFYNTSGFVDDTRAFLSIPARHDLSRRVDAGYLARLVAEHRLDGDEAVETAIDLAYRIPRAAYAPST